MAVKKIAGIYKITSPSGKVYIGHRKQLYSFLACKEQPLLFKSFKKYSYDAHSFEIIHELPDDVSQDIMDGYEQFYMDVHRDSGHILLNLRDAGARGKHSEATKQLLSVVKKRENLSPETRKRMSEAKKGWVPSEETRKLWSKQRTGKKHGRTDVSRMIAGITSESRRKAAEANRGQKRTPEQRKKISEASKGRITKDSTKAKLSENMKRIRAIHKDNWQLNSR